MQLAAHTQPIGRDNSSIPPPTRTSTHRHEGAFTACGVPVQVPPELRDLGLRAVVQIRWHESSRRESGQDLRTDPVRRPAECSVRRVPPDPPRRPGGLRGVPAGGGLMAPVKDGVIRRGRTWSYVIQVSNPVTGTSRPKWVGGFARSRTPSPPPMSRTSSPERCPRRLSARALAGWGQRSTKPAGQCSDLRVCGGQGRGRTADLPIFSRTLVPTELPGRGQCIRGGPNLRRDAGEHVRDGTRIAHPRGCRRRRVRRRPARRLVQDRRRRPAKEATSRATSVARKICPISASSTATARATSVAGT